MFDAYNRRGFLRGLVSLPLIGGGVTLIGQPQAAATPVTVDLLEQYHTFLLAEAGEVLVQIDQIAADAERLHWYQPTATRQWVREMGWDKGLASAPDIAAIVRGAPAGTRAAVVLAAVNATSPDSI